MTNRWRVVLMCAAAAVLLPVPATAQQGAPAPLQRPERISLAGPRVGITVLTGEAARIAEEDHGVKRPVVTQFGWQFERRFLTPEEGPTGVFEWVLLVGGLDQGAFFPSITWLTGIRTQSGVEFGVGPNATPLGLGFVVGGGITLSSGYMNFPLNVAVAASDKGVRTSVLAGFTTRR
jgi:hypothetical protein